MSRLAVHANSRELLHLFGAIISTAKQSHRIPYTTELLERLISRGGQFFHLY